MIEAPAKNQLNPASPGGCLSERVPPGRPQYALSDEQRASLAEWIKSSRQTPGTQDEARLLTQSLEVFSCLNCHARGDEGGLSNDRRDYFVSTIEIDLGDEGRIPPKLDRVGAKLTPEGFAKYLWEGFKAREYVAARMPQYGRDNVHHLPGAFAAVDAEHRVEVETPFSEKLVDDGRQLMGKSGLGCVNCHGFGPYKLQGAAGLDLWQVTERLDPGWTHALLRDPQAVTPGTRMPNAFAQDQPVQTDIQGGDPDRQIAAIRAYLSVQDKGGLPEGLRPSDSNLLVPAEDPIVFRTFLQGVGAHAVAVGFRQRTHMAFDALRIRSAKAWTGEFVNADAAWQGRAGQYAPIPHPEPIDFPPDSPFAVLDDEAASWPKLDMTSKQNPPGWRWRGYKFDSDRVPSFLYSFNGVDIEERPSTAYRLDGALLRRTLSLSSQTPPGGLTFRAAVGQTIEPTGDGDFLVDGRVRVHVEGATPRIRDGQHGRELVVPVEFSDPASGPAQARFVVDFSW